MVRTINGIKVPIGDDKKKKGAAAAAVAVVVGGAVAVGAGGAGGGAAALESSGGSSAQIKTSSKDSARKGKHEDAMRRLGLKTIKKELKRELKCAPFAFGQVQQFFLHHPCKSLSRMLLPLSDGAGNTVVVTIAWVRMPKAAEAGDLRDLADRSGTGNIYALPDALLKAAGVKFTGDHYRSRRDGSLVVIAEATSGGGKPSTGVLDDVAEVAVEFPAP